MTVYESVVIEPALDTADIASDTTTDGADHNRSPVGGAAFGSVAFYVDAGAYTDGTYVFGIEEADDDGSGSPDTYADAVAADVQGADAGDNELTVSDDSLENSQFFMGYVGSKQWVRLSIVSTSTSSGWADITAHAVLGDPDQLPVR